MEYRLDKTGLLGRLGLWDSFLKRKIHLIACGGAALTLLDIKPSTKDIDLIVPLTEEYHYLIKILKDLGVLNYYDIIISKLFRGTSIDMEDCLMLIRAKSNEINIPRLTERFNETASYDVSEDKVRKHLEHFKKFMEKERFAP